MGLRKSAFELLRRMRDEEAAQNWEDAEIVRDGRVAYIGCDRVPRRDLDDLLDVMAVSQRSEPGSMERYAINGTGRGILKRPDLADEVAAAVREGGAFSITEDGFIERLAGAAPR